ncbi:hypothetical protein H9P43_003204 [Blastocladiella emersonii ATCC 22665]|nr:hypothetical protein H9P43_003204 [Blastocladiella emersonii ATCC 22665]
MSNKHVRVVVRTRPTTQFASNAIEILPEKNIINIHVPKQEDAGYINNQHQDWSFKFDKVMHVASQDSVYDECAAPIVRSVLDGYNGTLLAYGQTGAGKTFTMTGATENYRQRGVIPRALSHIFREIQERPQYAYTVRISYLEIYNETMVDLLVPNGGGAGADMAVVEDKNGCYVKGQTQVIATSEEEALNLLFEGETNRSIGDHALNRTSSRSHCIFTVHVESKSRIDSSDDVIFSKLNLVDLAGSERLAKTNSSGRTLKEAMFINKSLTFLEQVIIALADKKRDHVPFRQSRLTNVLRDSLGGNCNTTMVANIWGEASQLEETISTLRFATRMMCVTNDPVVNVQYDPLTLIKKQEREIRELRQELAMHDTLIGRSHVQYEPFTGGQRADLTKRLKAWLDGGEEEIEIVTLRQVKEILGVFKVVYHKMQQDMNDRGGGDGVATKGSTAAGPAQANGDRDGAGNLDEDDGVGDTEGMGFSIGVAPSLGGNRRRGGGNAARKARRDNNGNGAATTSNSRAPAAGGGSGGQSNQATNGDASADDGRDSGDDGGRPSFAGAGRQDSTNSIQPGGTTALASLQLLSPLPPIPTKAIRPNRNDAFETYKRGPGKDLASALADNKAILRDKKKQLLAQTDRLTQLKQSIESLKTQIAADRDLALQADVTNDPALVTPPVSESTAAKLDRVRELKAEYKAAFDTVAALRTELEYAVRVVDTCRERLVREYEAWFETVFGEPVAGPGVVGVGKAAGRAGVAAQQPPAAAAAMVVAAATADLDALDLSERFDQMHNERLKEDPASYAYYAALKRTSRRQQRVGRS